MKIIVFKDVAYGLSEKQYQPISVLVDKMKDFNEDISDRAENDLYDHLVKNQTSYAYIGPIDNIFRF